MLSLSRVVVAIGFYLLSLYAKFDISWILLFLFVYIEASDFFDGYLARKLASVSDIGKLLDPCCDIVAHFLCLFALREKGKIASVIVAIFVFREVWMLFLRSLLQSRKYVLAAGSLGKLKTFFYALGIGVILVFDVIPLGIVPVHSMFLISDILLYSATALSVLSALQYYRGTRSLLRA